MATEKFSIKARARSFGYAGEGFKTFLRTQHNGWVHLGITLAAVVLGMWLRISVGEWIAVALSVGLVFGAELLNSAIECLADHVTLERHDTIKKVKDMAAAAVLVAALAALAVGLLIFLPKLWMLIR